eukprot:4013933-Pleurochrysis_carterae.AAC.1
MFPSPRSPPMPPPTCRKSQPPAWRGSAVLPRPGLRAPHRPFCGRLGPVCECLTSVLWPCLRH